MSDVVFSRSGWFPMVVRDDGGLRLELGAGSGPLRDPRTFSFAIADEHLEVIRDDLHRHLLLWSAILPLCDDAGIRGPLDEAAAVALLDPLLFGTPVEVESFFRGIRWNERRLIAQGADVDLLEQGRVWAALRSATVHSDWDRVKRFDADRHRTRRP